VRRRRKTGYDDDDDDAQGRLHRGGGVEALASKICQGEEKNPPSAFEIMLQ
jgi:hypothetical protein